MNVDQAESDRLTSDEVAAAARLSSVTQPALEAFSKGLTFEHRTLLRHLVRDRETDELDRRRCLAELMIEPTRAVAFCHAMQRRGPVVEEAVMRTLGHVVARRSFERDLGSVRNTKEPIHSSPSALVEAVLKSPLEGQRALLGDLELRQYQMWSFFDVHGPIGSDPTMLPEFVADPVEVLALPVTGIESLLVWSHRLPSEIEPHRPTCFDAVSIAAWRPGGRTAPPGGGAGFPEVVHQRVRAWSLVSPIRPIGGEVA